jgi:multiple sugar transport system permease protein
MNYRAKNVAKSCALHGVMLCASFVTVIPFIWMLSASFMARGHASTFPPRFIPDQFTWNQYLYLFQRLNIGRYFINSTILALSVTALSLFVNALAGFAFAKYHFRGKKTIFMALLSSMIIPGQVTMLPVFLLLNKMGFLNTYFGIIIPGLASIFGVFLIRQYLQSIPDSLIEAAYMDGAGDFTIFWRVIIPLAKPALITLGLFTFMGTWNDFMWPLVVMTRDSMYTLPVALATLSGEHILDPELMMAGSVVTILPIIILFIFLQRYYIHGIMTGAVKE